jgi:hypothetical protein
VSTARCLGVAGPARRHERWSDGCVGSRSDGGPRARTTAQPDLRDTDRPSAPGQWPHWQASRSIRPLSRSAHRSPSTPCSTALRNSPPTARATSVSASTTDFDKARWASPSTQGRPDRCLQRRVGDAGYLLLSSSIGRCHRCSRCVIDERIELGPLCPRAPTVSSQMCLMRAAQACSR